MNFTLKNVLRIILVLSCTGVTSIKPADADLFLAGTTIEEQENLDCAICADTIYSHQDVGTMPKCKHGINYHKICLNEWRKKYDTCPECRSKITVLLPGTEAFIDFQRKIEKININQLEESKEEALREFNRGNIHGVALGVTVCFLVNNDGTFLSLVKRSSVAILVSTLAQRNDLQTIYHGTHNGIPIGTALGLIGYCSSFLNKK